MKQIRVQLVGSQGATGWQVWGVQGHFCGYRRPIVMPAELSLGKARVGVVGGGDNWQSWREIEEEPRCFGGTS